MVAVDSPGRNPSVNEIYSRACPLDYDPNGQFALREAYRPRSTTALPTDLWNKPSLIDFDHWGKVCTRLRQQGTHGNQRAVTIVC